MALIVSAACDPGPPRDRLAVVAEDGGVRLLVRLCPDELIRQVTVYEVEGNVVGDDNDKVLWQASSDDGSSDQTLRVGGPAPEGYRLERQLRAPLNQGHLSVQVRTTDTRFHLSFHTRDLEARGYVGPSENAPPPDEAFAQQAPDCR